MKLASSEQMQALDLAAIKEFGIPGIVLMENAGRSTLDQMEAALGSVAGRSVCIFVGPGNNGGDGLVVARHVLQRDGSPLLVFLAAPERLAGDAAINEAVCAKLGIARCVIRQEEEFAQLRDQVCQLHFERPVHSLVDALFGTGLSRRLEGRFAAAVRFMNELARQQNWPLVAADIPSGLSAWTGMPLGCAVQAHLTVTYGLAKPGHHMHGGAAVGKLAVVDIGIPKQAVEAAQLQGELLDRESVVPLLRSRPRAGHKGTFGHLLVLAGSEGKTGAALLAAAAALRSGCGLTTLAVPAALNPIFEASVPEAMTVPLHGSDKCLSESDCELIMELAADKDAVVMGPGLGTAPETERLVQQLHMGLTMPVLADADALNLLARLPGWMNKAAGPRLLTPHPGEMSRLTGMGTAAIQSDRLSAALGLVRNADPAKEAVVVLKGAGSVVCSSKGRWAVCSSGNSGMAVGGMGDVLSGLIGGLLAQGYPLWDAAAAGTFLHGLAGDLLAEEQQHGFLASEVAAALPRAIMRTMQQI